MSDKKAGKRLEWLREELDDDTLISEVARRLDGNPDFQFELDLALYELNLQVTAMEPDTARRMWILGPGSWLSPNSLTDKPHPLVFLGGDEFGNRTFCVRLPKRRLWVLALNVPLKRVPERYDENGDPL